jgi:hypothetical protein
VIYFSTTVLPFAISTDKGRKNLMYKMIRFESVEIVSCACFFSGKVKRSGMDIVSIVLIPYYKSGNLVPAELPFPEIFLQ